MCVRACVCATSGRKRLSDPLELKSHRAVSHRMWVLRLVSSGRAAGVPHCGAASLSGSLYFSPRELVT